MENNKRVRDQFLLCLAMSAAAGGAVSMLASYFFLAGVGSMIIDQRVDQHVEDMDTADRIFLLDGPMVPKDGFRLRPVDRHFGYDVIADTNGMVFGVHVRFKPGNNAYVAEVVSPGRANQVVTLSRGDGAGAFKMGRQLHGAIRRHEDFDGQP